MYKTIIIIYLFCFCSFNIRAQNNLGNNLVPNPGFEEQISCPSSWSQICLANPWTDAWNCLGSSDFLHICSANTFIQNILSNNSPHNGNGCVGIGVYMDPSGYANYREYIEVRLKTKLKNDVKYCTSFYTILAKLYGVSLSNIDIFFSHSYVSPYIPLMPGYMLIDSIPQVMNNRGIINDTVNWSKISGIYLANGEEEYITIGNFNNDNLTNYVMDATKLHKYVSYYLFDDFSICECSFDINIGPDAKLCEGDQIILNPNLPNATYTWQDSSHAATYEVKQPGTYWVRAYVAEYDITSSDTIIITAEDESICNPPLIIPNFITPNGDDNNDYFKIGNADKYELSLQIFNRWGNMIYQNASYQNDFNCNECADGVYYYLLRSKSKRNGKEKEFKGSVTVMK